MQLVAKLLAFYFLLGSFLPKSDFGQLLKLSNLVQHFELHQQESQISGQSSTITSFLWDHFVNPKGHQHNDSNSSHQDLPFLSASSSGHFIVQRLILHTTESRQALPLVSTMIQQVLSLRLINNLFRPPIQ